MTEALDLVTVVGARPQFVKAGAVSRAILKDGRVRERMIHTGQHFDDNMSDVFFRELSMPPPWRRLGVSGGGHGAMTGRMMVAIEEALVADRPDAVLVYGDTNSTLAGALVAAKLHIPVVHVEAGLRSFNREMPEEVNRILTDHVSDLLFCPTGSSVTNLKKEGVTRGVEFVGDVSYDATLYAIDQSRNRSKAVEEFQLDGRPFALCTLHRAENTDHEPRLRLILDAVAREAQGMPIVFPVHPRTRRAMADGGLALPGSIPVDPLGYFDFHRLLTSCELVLTDSGGVQKEAYFHRKPCVTLRDETEWVETIDAGWNRLWTSPRWNSPRVEIDDYGRGDAAGTIVSTLIEQLPLL